jgi:hypothetical protein
MFFKLKAFFAAIALVFGLASMASAACIAGQCPTPVGTSTTYTNPNLPQPRDWASRIDFNAGWMAETKGLASGVGNNVNATSSIIEQYMMNQLGSVMADVNCGPKCGEQTFTSKWDLKQGVDNRVVANSTGHGTGDNPIRAMSGSLSMGAFEGFLGAQAQFGNPPIVPIPMAQGN